MKKPFVLLWIFLGGILVFSWAYLPTLSKYRDLKLQQDELDKQVTKLTQDVEEVHQERDLLKNDVEYLEKVIRDEMGLVKPGEIVYKFVQDKPQTEASPKVSETPSPAASVSASPAPSPTPSGEVFPAKPLLAKPKTSAVKSKTTAAVKKSVVKKPKVLPEAEEEPSYPRRETR